MDEVRYSPIGIIHTPFKVVEGMPIQPLGGKGVKGTVEIKPKYSEGLKDLEGFSHITLVYHFHKCSGHSLKVRPFLDQTTRGLFATRAPSRPNPIGISTVRLVRIEGCTLHIEDLDILDGTPLLDLKPFVPDFDLRASVRTGWLGGRSGNADEVRSNGRFSPP